MPIITESNRRSRNMQRFFTEHYGYTAPIDVFDQVQRMEDAGCLKLDIGTFLALNSEPFEPTQQ